MANLRANRIVSTTGSNAITGSVEFVGDTTPTAGRYGLTLPFTAGGDFDFGSGSFTIEGWYYANESKRVGIIAANNGTTTAAASIPFQIETTPTAAASGAVKVVLGDGTNSFTAQSVGVGSTTQSWNHFAVVRNGSEVKMYLNGVVGTGTTSITGSLATSGITTVYIGDIGFDTDKRFDGFISNLRVIKGTALYTSNFIPPTSKLKKLPGTVLLCCQDNESVTTEATGKTITANGNPAARRFVPQVGSDGGLVFDGATKVNTQNYFYLATGTTEDRVPINNNYGSRGVFGGGLTSAPTAAATNVIDYVTISSTGNAVDFGDITTSTLRLLSGCSSSTRGIFAGGFNSPVNINNIQYITLASTGNTIDTSDLTSTRRSMSGLANETRGIFAGGNPITNTIEYITIASLGNSSDFGDIITTSEAKSGLASPTRGIIAGGESPSILNAIDYITIASTGNSQDFGDLTQGRSNFASAANTVRGIFAGGETPTFVNTVDYVIIATIGNASDFGDLSQIRRGVSGSSSAIRGVFAGGSTDTPVSNTAFNTIDYISILTTANAFDFGDLTVSRWQSQYGIISSGHGGLG